MIELTHHEWWHVLDLLREADGVAAVKLADKIQFDEKGHCRLCQEAVQGDRGHRCCYPEISDDEAADLIWAMRTMLRLPDASHAECLKMWRELPHTNRARVLKVHSILEKRETQGPR